MAKFAHFENTPLYELTDLYVRHDEVARQIHEDSLRKFTGDDSLQVELVKQNPVSGDSDVVENLSNYDSVSVSSVIGVLETTVNNTALSDNGVINQLKKTIENNDMPIYVVSAGNEGETQTSLSPKVANFIRTSISVGEANLNGENGAYIEKHSSRLNPTLASDSPFNRGVAYPFITLSPSLDGHEGLIKDWVSNEEYSKRENSLLESDSYKGMNDEEKLEAQNQFEQLWRDADYKNSPEAQQQVKHYLDNPAELHERVINHLKESGIQITEKRDGYGYVTDLDGTSFSAPEMAGTTSGAVYEQEQREAQGLPILSKEEISTMARLATTDTPYREGQKGLVNVYNNKANFAITESGGHGVFQPNLFRSLLDKAYETIEKNPHIDRQAVERRFTASPDQENFSSGETVTINATNLDHNIAVESIRVDFYSDTGVTPKIAFGGLDGEQERNLTSNHSSKLFYNNNDVHEEGYAWLRLETDFGKIAEQGDQWTLRVNNMKGDTLSNAGVTVYGYNEGGLMHQMMQHSQSLTAQPSAPTPNAELKASPIGYTPQ